MKKLLDYESTDKVEDIDAEENESISYDDNENEEMLSDDNDTDNDD